MVALILELIEIDKAILLKWNVSLNCLKELLEFENASKKGLVDDLINISVFLKEKGEPFRILLFQLAKEYLSQEGYLESSTENKVFDRIGTFAIDTVASQKLSLEFLGSHSTLLSLEILNDMVHMHSFSLDNKLENIHHAEGISETGLERISSFNSFGWLTRFIQHRDSRLRFATWNTLKSLVSTNLLKQHPSLVDEALECFLNEDEIYSISISAINFL